MKDPIIEFYHLCNKYNVEDFEFVCKEIQDNELNFEWKAVIPFNSQFSQCSGRGKTQKIAKRICALQALIVFPKTNLARTLDCKRGITLLFSKQDGNYICVPKFTLPIEQLCVSVGKNPFDAEDECFRKLNALFLRMKFNTRKMNQQ